MSVGLLRAHSGRRPESSRSLPQASLPLGTADPHKAGNPSLRLQVSKPGGFLSALEGKAEGLRPPLAQGCGDIICRLYSNAPAEPPKPAGTGQGRHRELSGEVHRVTARGKETPCVASGPLACRVWEGLCEQSVSRRAELKLAFSAALVLVNSLTFIPLEGVTPVFALHELEWVTLFPETKSSLSNPALRFQIEICWAPFRETKARSGITRTAPWLLRNFTQWKVTVSSGTQHLTA